MLWPIISYPSTLIHQFICGYLQYILVQGIAVKARVVCYTVPVCPYHFLYDLQHLFSLVVFITMQLLHMHLQREK